MTSLSGASGILTPMLALVGWSLLVWAWMVYSRVTTMTRLKIHPQKARYVADLNGLPDQTRQASDNYNHLMEQPTLFYAVIAYTALAGQGDGINVILAWAYVGLRMIHTLVQTTVNVVMVRFYLFVASTLVLAAIVVRDSLALIH